MGILNLLEKTYMIAGALALIYLLVRWLSKRN
jgi:hypothetical protein